MSAHRIEVTQSQGIATVLLNRPEQRNALDMDMFRAIDETQRRLRRDRSLRAVILAAEGPDFSSGLDVRSIMGSSGAARRLLWKWWPGQANLAQRVSVCWGRLPVPVIVAIHGRCWGGGLQIALGGDVRIAQPAASLSIMEGRWGLIPDMGGTLALRTLMPRDQALLLTLTAAELNAARALELGLVTETHDEPLERAREIAADLVHRSPDAIAAAKRLYQRSWGGRGRVLARETLYQMGVLAGANQRIAVRRARGDHKPWRQRARWWR